MQYVSTRGEAPEIGFTEALLAGLARDGGLYVPKTWPVFSDRTIAGFAGKSYAAVAQDIVQPFVGSEIAHETLARMVEGAYASFRHDAVCPLVQIADNLFVLELFHGPTLAFKDVAMQLLARMMEEALQARSSRATIVGATSGDTGSAAVEAFCGLSNVDIFILYPHGRVSDVQRRQMTTLNAPNVHAIAVEGTFDDCQNALKAMFADENFREPLHLTGVNSINWARVAAQMVYYFTAAVALGSPSRPVSFAVPTGNFGDILAGFCAKKTGLPIDRLIIATNVNDILVRTLETGRHALQAVVPTTSPSMDIQISSNFERLLFEAFERDSAAVRGAMDGLRQSGSFNLEEKPLARIRQDFEASAVSEEEVAREIRRTWRRTGYLLDPHTAIATKAARDHLTKAPSVPVIALSTAHPAKFPDAVERAAGVRPPLPPHLCDLMDRQEAFTILPNDQAAIRRFIKERARAGQGIAA